MMKTSRRAVLAGIAAMPFVPALAHAQSGAGVTKYDDALDAVIDSDAQIEFLGSGYQWAEGPTWVKQGGYLLFNDPPRNVMYKWDAAHGVQTFMAPSGLVGPVPEGVREMGANGIAIDAKGKLVIADSGTRAVARVDLVTKQKEIIVDRFEGKRFSSINDVTIAKNGIIYFTDPPYGFTLGDDSPLKEIPFNGLYSVDPKTGKARLLDKGMRRPNGVAVSPDQKLLYVAQSDELAPALRVYQLDGKGGIVGEGRTFHDFADGVAAKLRGLPDGLRVDPAGRVFATGPGGVYVLSPEGKRLGLISTGKAVANCCFGEDGKTLFLTTHDSLAKVRLKSAGW